jgi:FAD/FMN-containing dehydrogenase
VLRRHETICAEQCADSEPVDFVDGTVFGPDRLYLTVGAVAGGVPATSDYTGMDVYYQSIPRLERDYLTIHDYLWRWDTDWFWCSRAFGAQVPAVRRVWPKRRLRSAVYWRLAALEQRFGVKQRLERALGRPAREAVIQDVQIPIDRAATFLEFLHAEVGTAPIWLCPIRQRTAGATWDLYRLDPATLYVNFGFWGTVPRRPGGADGARNRRVEEAVAELGGRKSLYSTAFYDPEVFWQLYGGARYHDVKARYDPQGRLLDLYEKCVQRR